MRVLREKESELGVLFTRPTAPAAEDRCILPGIANNSLEPVGWLEHQRARKVLLWGQ